MKSHYRHVADIYLFVTGAPPHVERIDFSNYIRKNEGSNLTLTTKISSNIPLSGGYPIWVVDFRLPLPSTAVVDNYTTTDGALYNRLLLYELSFEDDTGNYTNIVSNQCGTSSVSVFIDVRKGTRLNAWCKNFILVILIYLQTSTLCIIAHYF